MKKDLVFAPILFAVGVALFLLKWTGMPVHIAISAVGIVALAVYTVACKKEWKLPAVEIAMRAAYGVALISGIVLKVNYVSALGVAHKIFAVLFVALLIVLLVHKLAVNKQN